MKITVIHNQVAQWFVLKNQPYMEKIMRRKNWVDFKYDMELRFKIIKSKISDEIKGWIAYKIHNFRNYYESWKVEVIISTILSVIIAYALVKSGIMGKAMNKVGGYLDKIPIFHKAYEIVEAYENYTIESLNKYAKYLDEMDRIEREGK